MGLICIGIALIFFVITGMARNLSREEEQVLRAERDDLLAQATAFFEEDDYELLPELFLQIAEVSHKLGDYDLAEGFKRKADEMRALFISQDAPLEPEILSQDKREMPPAIPSASSFNLPPSIKTPHIATPSVPQPPPEPFPAIKLAPLPVLKEAPSKKPKDALTEKIEKLKNLLNAIPTSELNAPAPKILITPPSRPADESREITLPSIGPAPTEAPPIMLPSIETGSINEPPPITPYEPPPVAPDEPPPVAPNEPPLIAPNEPPLIAPDEPPLIAPNEPPLVAPNEPPLIALDEPEIIAPYEPPLIAEPVTTDELLDILGPSKVKPPTSPPTTEELLNILGPPKVKPPTSPPTVKGPLVILPPIKKPRPSPSSAPFTAAPPRNKQTVNPPSTTLETQSLINERRTEQGKALQSGIVPKIVKNEEEIISEILNEKVPFLPDNEKKKAIEKILTYSPGAAREAWLKVFLIKNKQYTRK